MSTAFLENIITDAPLGVHTVLDVWDEVVKGGSEVISDLLPQGVKLAFESPFVEFM